MGGRALECNRERADIGVIAKPRTHASRHTTRTTAFSRPCDRRPARDRVGDPRCCSRWGCNGGPERRLAREAIVGAGAAHHCSRVLAIVSTRSAALCLCHARASGGWLLLTREAIVWPRAGAWWVAGARDALPRGALRAGRRWHASSARAWRGRWRRSPLRRCVAGRSTACAWRGWWGAKRRRTPASTAIWCSCRGG